MTIWNNWLNQGRLQWKMWAGWNRAEVNMVVRTLKDIEMDRARQADEQDRELITDIQQQTAYHNRNNLTRTAAYLDFFRQHQEVHWALLAHVVSRNGGWSMTDTRGDWFMRMSDERSQGLMFAFLERANWLIFQDAYPQLLLYAEAKRRSRDLSDLLPHLEISKFMQAIWRVFWHSRKSTLLTRALIINEQNYIEKRVMQNPNFQGVIASFPFHVQSLFNLNQVLMPYQVNAQTRLIGTTMRHFAQLEDRIGTGLRLYHGLFQGNKPEVRLYTWLNTVEHTASRADYWPHVFHSHKDAEHSAHYRPIFGKEQTSKQLVYSPRLVDVWQDVAHPAPERGDWFTDLRHAVYLWSSVNNKAKDTTKLYTHSIQTIEKAIIAKEKLARLSR